MIDAADNIVPFGKYEGQPVETMLADHSYCEWRWLIRERYANFVGRRSKCLSTTRRSSCSAI
jgi:hypothetical protein